MSDTSQAMQDVIVERKKQIEKHGWTQEHDDGHRRHELRDAAVAYALGRVEFWPWEMRDWNPGDYRRNLVKAAALLIAEIERLDRQRKGGDEG